MEWVRYEIGRLRWVGETNQPGVVIELERNVPRRRLASDGWHVHSGKTRERAEGDLGPFRWEDRGKKRRLAWERGSALFAGYSTPVSWSDTYVAVVDVTAVSVVALYSDRVARLGFGDFEPKWSSFDLAANDGRLWVSGDEAIFAIPLADLEQLVTGSARDVAITVRTEYPNRRPNASLDCVYLWRLQSGMSMIEVGDGMGGNDEEKILVELPAELKLAKHSPIVVSDELSTGRYARAEIPGRVPLTLREPAAPETFTAKLKLSAADHPDGIDRRVVAHAGADQRARIDALIAAIGEEPDADGHRAVLLDLLNELEDPAAPVFAAMAAGEAVSAARKKAALGTLAPFLVDVEFRAGLPVKAKLSRLAPRARALVAEAIADYRLGLLTELEIGAGPHEVYTSFVCASRAAALRRIDITHPKTAQALVAANRTQFTRLGHLELVKKRNMAKLAAPAFDRATTFHAVIANAEVAVWMDAIIGNPAGVYTRVPRTLELEEASGRHDTLRKSLLPWVKKLPFRSVSVGGLVLLA